MENLKIVGQPVRKKDAMSLLLGKPAYVDDVTPQNCLVVKVLRSPHAHALIEEINTERGPEGARRGCRIYLQGCAPEALYHGGSDLPGALSL